MRAVDLKTLKNKLSEYVRVAASGETVLVTDRGRVVAELGPPAESRRPILGDALPAEAFRKGWITAPAATGLGAPPSKPMAPLQEILAEMAEDRRDR